MAQGQPDRDLALREQRTEEPSPGKPKDEPAPAQSKPQAEAEKMPAKPRQTRRRGSSSPPSPAVTPNERPLGQTLEQLRRSQRPDIVRRDRRDRYIDDEDRVRLRSPHGTIMPTPPSRSIPGTGAITPMSPPGAVLPTPPSMPLAEPRR